MKKENLFSKSYYYFASFLNNYQKIIMAPCLTGMFPVLITGGTHWNQEHSAQLQPLELNREWSALNMELSIWLNWIIQASKKECFCWLDFNWLNELKHPKDSCVITVKSNYKYSSLKCSITLKKYVWVGWDEDVRDTDVDSFCSARLNRDVS